MVAVYPGSVKSFSYRQDYTEIVEAGDVNVAYDEISATQNILGVNPNTDIIDGVVNTWPTVKANISSAREGYSLPFANVSADNILVPYATQYSPSFNHKTWDTHSMWNGASQLICKRSGVYTFDAYVRWHRDDLPADSQQPVFDRSGELMVIIQNPTANFNYVNQGGYFPQGWQKSTHQSASINYPWFAGQSVQVYLYQSCLTTPISATVSISATFVRGVPTINNL